MRAWYLPILRKLTLLAGAGASWRPLARSRTRILRAVIAAMRPREHGFDQPIDEEVLRGLEGSLRDLPQGIRIGLELGLYLIEYGPPLWARRRRRFSSMAPGDGQRYLTGWEHARGPRGAVFRGMRTLVFLHFYQHADVLRRLEVGWADRAATLTRLRAELLHDQPGGSSSGG